MMCLSGAQPARPSTSRRRAAPHIQRDRSLVTATREIPMTQSDLRTKGTPPTVAMSWSGS